MCLRVYVERAEPQNLTPPPPSSRSRVNHQDESVSEFVSRVLGPEVLERLADPFISTVYCGDPAAMSMRSAFPAIQSLADRSNGVGGL